MKKYISLSFDDGPSTDSIMDDMLTILKKHNVLASFFIIGQKVNDTNLATIQRAIDMGCDIQNHTWTHRSMTELSEDEIREEYEKTDELIKRLTGRKAEFFRPPYINVCDLMYKVIKTPFICGSGCNDWDPNYDAEYRYTTMLSRAENGLIYLLHVSEGNSATLSATDRIIPVLKEQGYEFVTVPEIFRLRGVNPDIPNSLWTLVS